MILTAKTRGESDSIQSGFVPRIWNTCKYSMVRLLRSGVSMLQWSCQEAKNPRSREVSGVAEEYRSTGVQEYWSTGVLEYWSTGVLEYWSTGVQEFRSSWSSWSSRVQGATEEGDTGDLRVISAGKSSGFFRRREKEASDSNTPILPSSRPPVLPSSCPQCYQGIIDLVGER
jgi:hypothetical protein